jgi:type I restriction enzyme S subunit
MKDSGVEWIGQIPEDWDVIKAKYTIKVVSGNGFSMDMQGRQDGEIPFYKVSDINGDDVYVSSSKNYVSYKDANKNKWNIIGSKAILMAKIGEALKKNHRKISTQDCIVDNNTQALLLLDNQNDKYNYYLWKIIDATWFDNGGTIPSVSNRRLLNWFIPNISLKTQHRIAAYLDEKVAHIDNIIDKTKKTIEEYKKYKQSLITEAVTKGLNPDVKMKDSGVEWIGEIPEHWGVNKVKYASAFNPNTTKEFDASQPVGYVPMDSVKNGYMKPLQATYDNLSTGLVKFQEGDIVMAKVTPCFENGNIAIADSLEQKVAFGSSELFIFRNQNINRCYLFYFLQMTGFKNMCISTMTGTGGLKRVSAYFIKNAIIPFPPQEEQSFVVKHLKDMCNSVDVLISQKQDIISNLESYKKSLIYEVVTGKREVS